MGPTNVAHTAAIARMAPYGCFVEVGVYKGGMAWHLAEIARERGVALHLFDTFTGIPFADPGDNNPRGAFNDTSLAAVQEAIPDAEFHVGVFPDTLPADLGKIAFIHCDCDQYRSVRAVIDYLWPLVVPGGIMVVDDLDTDGGKRAMGETFGAADLLERDGRWYVRKAA